MMHNLRQIALGAILFFSLNEARGQTSANATLNVNLAEVCSIQINPGQTTVTLAFATAADYNNGVTVLMGSHLVITSTGGFIVKVKSSSPNLVSGSNSIPVNTITLTPILHAGSTTVQSGGQRAVGYYVPSRLSQTAGSFINSSYGADRVSYDVKYEASGGAAYVNKPPGNYQTTITYTIEPM